MQELRQELAHLREDMQVQGKLTAGMAAERDAAKAAVAEAADSVQVRRSLSASACKELNVFEDVKQDIRPSSVDVRCLVKAAL